jgi:uncharacterized membrane protein
MRLRELWEDLRSSLWLRPTVWTIVLGLLALLLIWVETEFTLFDADSPPWFLSIRPEGARTMLGSISTSMLTVTTLVFSVTMVAVVQTSNAYSPRILREYLSDTSNHHVMGILIGTFLYGLLVLRSVESGEAVTFVPVIATNGALLLSVLCLGAFIYFLDHVAHSIRVHNMINLILRETHTLAIEPFPHNLGKPGPPDAAPTLDDEPTATLCSPANGYIEFFEGNELLRMAREHDLVIQLLCSVGDYVLKDMPLAHVHADTQPDEEVLQKLQSNIHLDSEQTLVQDVLFGMRQLSDIALRALSPGINDPTTAVECIDALSVIVDRFVTTEPASPYRCDQDGNLRLVTPVISFEMALEHAFGQIRRYGAADVVVVLRLLEVCADLGQRARCPQYQETIWRVTSALSNAADREILDSMDRQMVNEQIERVAATLQRDGVVQLLSDRRTHQIATMSEY